jgi:hypothetical protein
MDKETLKEANDLSSEIDKLVRLKDMNRTHDCGPDAVSFFRVHASAAQKADFKATIDALIAARLERLQKKFSEL